jgi:S1-C subfamily serine protease
MSGRRRRPSSEPPRGALREALEAASQADTDRENGETADEVEADDERPHLWSRLDLLVVIAGLALLAAGGLAHRSLSAPSMTPFAHGALSFDRPATWLPPRHVEPRVHRLAAAVAPTVTPPTGDHLHLVLQSSIDPVARIEIRVADRPRYGNLRGLLALERHGQYGALLWAAPADHRSIGDDDWLRTRFRYAYQDRDRGPPAIAAAVEYATITRNQLYVVTLHGTDAEVARLEQRVAPTLAVDPAVAGPGLLPVATERGGELPPATRAVVPAVVLVMAADLVDGRLTPVSSGSGTIVGADGSILTNYHVLADEVKSRTRDLFVIGRYRPDSRDPELSCAGRPARGHVDPDSDLALIKCDLDMNGQPHTPRSWPTAPLGRSDLVVPGEKLWILGYPDSGAGTLDVTVGRVSGWLAEGGGVGRDFFATDASLSAGNSGGAAVDEEGTLVGVPTAFRIPVTGDGTRMPVVGPSGLIRPLERAQPLLSRARAGWVPRERGAAEEATDEATDDEAPDRRGPDAAQDEPDPREAEPGPAEQVGAAPSEGVIIGSLVLDAANDRPVAGAVVIVFGAGIRAGEIDLRRIEEQATAWGQSNAEGQFVLHQPVPRGHRYTVAVLARGYHPLVAEDVLALDARVPDLHDPWGVIRLERR